MDIGKISSEILQKSIITPLEFVRKEVLLRPGIGEDCSALQLDRDEVFVLTTDPITGANENIGALAVHVCCNDLASSGAEPLGIMVTLMLPPGTSEDTLKNVMNQIALAAKEVNIDILGGHTEITPAVNKIVVSATAVGKVDRNKLVSSGGAKIGDDVVLTKTAGVEGTAIIATEKEYELQKILSKETIDRGKELTGSLSVIQEGIIAAEIGVNSMHDVTEGGVLGAVWEIAEASKVGVEIYKEAIPVREETLQICEVFHIDPLKLISSGSMLITTPNGIALIEELSKKDIQATIIGKITAENKILVTETEKKRIEEPEADELYKVI